MAKLEIYPSAPLRFVALEIRFGFNPQLATADGQAAVFEQLQQDFPLAEAAENVQVTVAPGAAPQQFQDLRMKNSERTWSVTVSPELLAVRTSAYQDFKGFAATVRRAIDATFSAEPVPTTRIGIRYIDEIRAPGTLSPMEWAPYVDDRLFGCVAFAEDKPIEWAQGMLALTMGEERHLQLRYGPSQEPVVDPEGPLFLEPIQGPIFVLDVDSYWQFSDPNSARFLDGEEIGGICRELDSSAYEIFERAITDKLRDDVLRKERDG
jgi:uncharacterized protein (TIGR04255 family)